jgi:bifunctional ADP-heptose synthase (sugar kinase/adenylyltransferase)
MTKPQAETYELVFRNGVSLILHNLHIDVEHTNREITKFDITANNSSDAIKFIDIGELACVVRRAPSKKRWWNK